jgi:hypothetical protein
MLRKFIRKIEGINPWHFLWIAVVFSEVFTLIMNCILSLIWWGHISIDLLLIGSIDAFIVALLVSIIIIYFLSRIKESNTTNRHLSQEVKALRGILPICSNCNSIRDKEGLWKGIEKYIRQHSEAEFTHSICPDCVRELYPDMANKILAKEEHKSK